MNISVIGTGYVGLVTDGAGFLSSHLCECLPGQCTAAPGGPTVEICHAPQAWWQVTPLSTVVRPTGTKAEQRILQVATRAMHPNPDTADKELD
jgi:hypothetical protein